MILAKPTCQNNKDYSVFPYNYKYMYESKKSFPIMQA